MTRLVEPAPEHRELSHASARVPQHGDEMTAAARKDQEMPDEVAVAHPFGGEEPYPDGVRDPAGQEPQQTRRGNALPQRPNRDEKQPPHPQVDAGGEPHEPDSSHERQDDPYQGEAPDEPEERPAPHAPQHTERERRVGTGDEQEDGSVIDHPKHALCLVRRQGVIQGGGQVQRHDRPPEDARAEYAGGAPPPDGRADQRRHGPERRQEAHAMTYAVRDLFAARLQPTSAVTRHSRLDVPAPKWTAHNLPAAAAADKNRRPCGRARLAILSQRCAGLPAIGGSIMLRPLAISVAAAALVAALTLRCSETSAPPAPPAAPAPSQRPQLARPAIQAATTPTLTPQQ